MPSDIEYLGKNKQINTTKPILSVLILTYQHSKYISHCLDTVLMQKTD